MNPPSLTQGPGQGTPPVRIPGYEVLRVLGRGGMGVVSQARHVRLNCVVALKMILSGQGVSAEELARFRLNTIPALPDMIP